MVEQRAVSSSRMRGITPAGVTRAERLGSSSGLQRGSVTAQTGLSQLGFLSAEARCVS